MPFRTTRSSFRDQEQPGFSSGIGREDFPAWPYFHPGGSRSDQVGTASHGVSRAMDNMLQEGFSLRDEENRRFAGASRRLTGATDAMRRQQTFSEEDYDRFFRDEFTFGSDRAAADSFGDFGAIRGRLGQAGIVGGGIAAGLGMQAELKRLRETKDRAATARLDLRKAKMQADASDALRNIQAEFQLAQFNNQSPSMLGLDVITNMAEVDLTRMGLFLGDQAAARAADASERAGMFSLAGGILGGLGGMF